MMDQKTNVPSTAPLIVWFRRDLRLADNPALFNAVEQNRPLICLFILDEIFDQRAAAPKWRLSRSLQALEKSLRHYCDAPLVLRQGAAHQVIHDLVTQTGAQGVYWNRCYSPDEIKRDRAIKEQLKTQKKEARSFQGSLMFEPHRIQNKAGTFFKVYSPFWRAVSPLEVAMPLPVPPLWAPFKDVTSERLESWQLEKPMNRAGAVFGHYVRSGEAAAQAQLEHFAQEVDLYAERRNTPSVAGTSGLSPALSLGEISPNQIYHHVVPANKKMTKGLETYVKELVWREFAYHLMYHTPHMLESCWRPEWDVFPWNGQPETELFNAWCYGMTGYAFVDAAMRELYVTGVMHNRSRMIVASFLTKHLGIDWRLGMRWFEECLVDWDPASNAMGWQWVAGCGPDASPYFRVFNPITQLDKFDPDGDYVARWLNIGARAAVKSQDFEMFFNAVPKRLGLRSDMEYPRPIVVHEDARKRALEAYEAFKIQKGETA